MLLLFVSITKPGGFPASVSVQLNHMVYVLTFNEPSDSSILMLKNDFAWGRIIFRSVCPSTDVIFWFEES